MINCLPPLALFALFLALLLLALLYRFPLQHSDIGLCGVVFPWEWNGIEAHSTVL